MLFFCVGGSPLSSSCEFRFPYRVWGLILGLIFCALVATWGSRARGQFLDDFSHLVATVQADRKPFVAGSDATIAVIVDVDPEWHLQSAVPLSPLFIPATLKIPAVQGLSFGQPRWPVGKEVSIPEIAGFGSKASVYAERITILIPVTVEKDAAAGVRTIRLTLNTQACSDRDNNCVPPVNTQLSIKVEVAPAGTAAVLENAETFAAANAQAA
jgi:hypothetical protein